MTMTLNALLRHKRREKGWTIKHVGSVIDAHQSLISAYETGKRRPTPGFLRKLAKLYDIPYTELFNMREKQTESTEYIEQQKLFAAEKLNKKYVKALEEIRQHAKEGNVLEIKVIANSVLYL